MGPQQVPRQLCTRLSTPCSQGNSRRQSIVSTTNSRGSIRPKNGGWELRVYLGRDFDGKPQQASRSVQGSRAEAEAALTEMLADIAANGPGAARPSTFTDLFVRRMKIDDELEESTARGYWSWFRNHI